MESKQIWYRHEHFLSDVEIYSKRIKQTGKIINVNIRKELVKDLYLNLNKISKEENDVFTKAKAITHCFVVKENKAYYGYSICSKTDNFSRPIGRRYALRRAEEAEKAGLGIDIMDTKKSRKELMDFCKELREVR